MNKKEIIKNSKGITLVALVVTIIVLIILAGVSINILMGNDGIITKAKQAKENMEIATIEEQEQLNELYEKLDIDNVSDGSLNDAIAKLVDFKNKIAIAITESGIETSASDSAETMSNNIKQLASQGSTEGSRQKLYEALKYSELVTEDMTFDEMCEVLKEEYPETIFIHIDDLKFYPSSPIGGHYYSEPVLAENGNTLIMDWTVNSVVRISGYRTNLIDFSKYSKVVIDVTSITWKDNDNPAWEALQFGTSTTMEYDATNSPYYKKLDNVVKLNREFVGTYEIDVSNITDPQYLMLQMSTNCTGTKHIEMTISLIK